MDYSKWDNIEISDDEDIEVHPNVDKRSFIQLKQRQIHEQRAQRRRKIEQLTKDLEELPQIIEELQKRVDGDESEFKIAKSKEIVAKFPGKDALADHIATLREEQDDTAKELKQLQDEEDRILSFDKLSKTGFDATIIRGKGRKAQPEPSESEEGSSTAEPSKSKNVEYVTINNPTAVPETGDEYLSDPVLAKFGSLKSFEDSYKMIQEHNELAQPRLSESLMLAAFQAQMDGKENRAKTYVHQAKVLQFSVNLGRDGVGMFFQRMQSGHEPAIAMFKEDLEHTYAHVKVRSEVMVRKKHDGTASGSSVININSDDGEQMEVLRKLPDDFRMALLSEDLDEVNRVVRGMDPVKAQEMLKWCHNARLMNFADPEGLGKTQDIPQLKPEDVDPDSDEPCSDDAEPGSEM